MTTATTTPAFTQEPGMTRGQEGVCAYAMRDWVLFRGGSAFRFLYASPEECQQLAREIGPCRCGRCGSSNGGRERRGRRRTARGQGRNAHAA